MSFVINLLVEVEFRREKMGQEIEGVSREKTETSFASKSDVVHPFLAYSRMF